MIKLHVSLTTEKTVDGDQLQVVEVYPVQEEDKAQYIIFWKKGSEVV